MHLGGKTRVIDTLCSISGLGLAGKLSRHYFVQQVIDPINQPIKYFIIFNLRLQHGFY
jgi:hypothetical protein